MRVYHLASFAGNIGDVANHQSFYVQFSKKLHKELIITKDEIRDYYRSVNLKEFNSTFVEQVNKHDLFIIGGGNFFELCWDYSVNGTTFNISNELLKQIKTPILINGIGIDDNKGASIENIEKFRTFLSILFTYNKVFFTVRNDGSYDIFKKYFPEYIHHVLETPDFGFFISEVPELKHYKPESETKSIGFNIALDMPQIRYSKLTYNSFLEVVANQINRILNQTDYHIYLFAHIQSDYRAILDILDNVNSKHVRTRISINALIQGRELDSFRLYKECNMVFAMRFHANVCSISLGIPTFGMVSYPKHGVLYDKICMSHRKVSLDQPNFIEQFEEEVNHIMLDSSYFYKLKDEYHNVKLNIISQKDRMLDYLINWLGLHEVN